MQLQDGAGACSTSAAAAVGSGWPLSATAARRARRRRQRARAGVDPAERPGKRDFLLVELVRVFSELLGLVHSSRWEAPGHPFVVRGSWVPGGYGFEHETYPASWYAGQAVEVGAGSFVSGGFGGPAVDVSAEAELAAAAVPRTLGGVGAVVEELADLRNEELQQGPVEEQ